MRHITLRQRLRYFVDNTMSSGPIVLIGWLSIVSLILVMLASCFVILTRSDPEARSFLAVAWASLMRMLDPGTMGGDVGSWTFLVAMLAVTLGGLLMVSTLVGILTTGIEAKFDQLRKGRSFVAERNHTIILGWSSQIFTIISELIIANENRGRSCIAILAPRDRLEMEDEIRARIPSLRRTRVVCRTGNPIDMTDLKIVNPHAARSIIILGSDPSDPDAHIIKVILALTNSPSRPEAAYHIVAALRSLENLRVARSIAPDEVKLVLADHMSARIAAQVCRQSGLSIVTTDLLDFSGDEIYFQEEPRLVGRTFGEALLRYEDSSLIGIRRSNGDVVVHPAMEARIEPGDQVIAISEDDDTVILSDTTDYDINEGAIKPTDRRDGADQAPEQALILGWNHRAPAILRELDSYVQPGSLVTVVTDEPIEGGNGLALQACNDGEAYATAELEHLRIRFLRGQTTSWHTLTRLSIPESFDHVIVLACCDWLDEQETDARTLITLLHLRQISEEYGHRFSIVSEMLDSHNRDLAEVTQADDFVISDHLISLMLTQVSENRQLADVFEQLFDPAGSEIYLKPIHRYVELGRSLNSYTLVEAARRRGEIAIGYRLHALAHDQSQTYGVRLNPPKSERVTFSVDDRVIVLAAA